MVNNLQNGSGAMQVPVRVPLGINLSNVDCNALDDETNHIRSNRNLAVELGYISHLWLKAFSPSRGDTKDLRFLAEGYQKLLLKEPVEYVFMDLQIEKFQGNLTYGDIRYGNFGILTYKDGDGYNFPVQWINFTSATFRPQDAGAYGWEIFLKQGVKANIRTYGQSSVPKLVYDYQGTPGNFDPFNGTVY